MTWGQSGVFCFVLGCFFGFFATCPQHTLDVKQQQATYQKINFIFSKHSWNISPTTPSFLAVCKKACHNHTDQHSLYLLANYEIVIIKMKNGTIDFQSYNSNVPLC